MGNHSMILAGFHGNQPGFPAWNINGNGTHKMKSASFSLVGTLAGHGNRCKQFLLLGPNPA
jgi:hypothetical protein